jgi:hypothetical protein
MEEQFGKQQSELLGRIAALEAGKAAAKEAAAAPAAPKK